ncbi:30S ribosomal protein S10 [Candidatus Gromoviella agglomerans]|uniref:30S ribosomal protein S10 n=1 Tax=Candidatus Gromoviella agglomerans TaxID=2806609 RepID=UPI001E29BF04|nr:30S ribosomal protein S10 [Candidatus Gromoviella agglomerans]UFX98558.1 30S ribosomal protein S10 [Candidatus Gromoviella agglomerans]
MEQKFRLILKSYDYRLLDSAASMISEVVFDNGAMIRGPVPLPNSTERFCVLRGPHVDKKSREHFKIVTHKRLIDVLGSSSKTINAMMDIPVPSGVFIEMIQIKSEY